MPYMIIKNPFGYEVINPVTGHIHSYHATLSNAKKQIKLLHMLENYTT